MSKFQILCVTMGQTDFSKLEEMNIHSDVIFANQADRTEKQVLEFGGHTAQMITTDTRGAGKNRNIALTYASADICMLADDDVRYDDDMEERIVREFEAHPDADIVVFHLDTDSERKQVRYPKTKKCRGFFCMPWGAVRIAFRRGSVQKANLWFNTLFGGGCMFPSGEDSLWLKDAKRKGLTFYRSKETIGNVSMEVSSWFTGYDEKFFFGKGACCAAMYGRLAGLWNYYYLFRYRRAGMLSVGQKIKWMRLGGQGYVRMCPFDQVQKTKQL